MVLTRFDELRTAYSQQFEKRLPLIDDQNVLSEFYSLLFPITSVIKACQRSDIPAAPAGYWRLLELRKNVLDIRKPLPILDPATEKPRVTFITNMR